MMLVTQAPRDENRYFRAVIIENPNGGGKISSNHVDIA